MSADEQEAGMRVQVGRKALILAMVLSVLCALSCAITYHTGIAGFADSAMWLNISEVILLSKYVFNKVDEIKK